MRCESEGVKKFLEDAQGLLRRFDTPAPFDLNFLQWLYNEFEKVVGKQLKNKDFWTDFHVLRTSCSRVHSTLEGLFGSCRCRE